MDNVRTNNRLKIRAGPTNSTGVTVGTLRLRRPWLEKRVCGVLVLALLSAASQAQALIWDAGSIPNDSSFLTYYTTINSYQQGVDGPEVDLTLNQLWAQVGQVFPTAHNWGASNGLGFSIQNFEAFPISMGIVVNTASGGQAQTIFTVPANNRHKFFVDDTGFVSAVQGMDRPLPIFDGEYHHAMVGSATGLSAVKNWSIYYRGSVPAHVRITGMRGYQVDLNYPNTVDRFGQLSYLQWNLKAAVNADLVTEKNRETAELAANPSINETWGSNGLPPAIATGRWRTIKSPNGKAYFVTPAGKIFWSVGITSITPGYSTIVEGREQMFMELPAVGSPEAVFYGSTVKSGVRKETYDFSKVNAFRKYGGGAVWETNWHDRTSVRLRSWGINTLGSGSDMGLMDTYDFPATNHISTLEFPVRLASPFPYWETLPDPYAATFTSWIVERNQPSLQSYASHGRLIGVYVDGENAWAGPGPSDTAHYQIPLAALRAPRLQPSKQIFMAQLRGKYSTIAGINAAWGTSFASWDFMYDNAVELKAPYNSAVKTDLTKFLSNFVAKYYSGVRNALTAMNLNILLLGSLDTLALTPPEVHFEAAKYVDVISVTSYGLADAIDWPYLNSLKKPVLVAEYSYASNDRGPSANTNWIGELQFGAAQRAIEAGKYLDQALLGPNIIAAHWYTYQDNIVCGRSTDLQNYPVGVVDVTDRPYGEMTGLFRKFTSEMYEKRSFQ